MSKHLVTSISNLSLHITQEVVESSIHAPQYLTNTTSIHISSVLYVSNAFLAASTIFLTSCTPLSTTFSICVPAFFKSSGLADFANCIALNFFCCPCLAFLTALFATSPAFAAALTVAFLDSAVGTGMGMERRRGFWPVGSAWGVRFRFADWIVEVIGLRCCVSGQFLSCHPSSGKKEFSYLLLSNHNLHNASFRNHLSQIP